MQPVNQLLQRNITLFNQGNWLFVNPPEQDLFTLCLSSSFHVLHQTVDVFQQVTGLNKALTFDSRDIAANPNKLRASATLGNHTHEFAPFVTKGSFTDALIYMPKSKNQFAMLVHMAVTRLKEDGSLYVVGDNKSGIKSIAKYLQKFGPVTKVDSARHCTLISVSVENKPAPFNPIQYLHYTTYEQDGVEWECASFPGIFSDGELDEGTALLLEKMPQPLHGHILDFACGAGVITCYLGKRLLHTKFDLLDVSAIALYCAAHSLEANKQQGNLIASNGLKGVSHKYQNIVTNPPFHTGTKTDYSIVSAFVSDSVHCLTKGGKLFVVANRFLPYAEQLKAHYSQVDVLAQSTKFSVYKSA